MNVRATWRRRPRGPAHPGVSHQRHGEQARSLGRNEAEQRRALRPAPPPSSIGTRGGRQHAVDLRPRRVLVVHLLGGVRRRSRKRNDDARVVPHADTVRTPSPSPEHRHAHPHSGLAAGGRRARSPSRPQARSRREGHINLSRSTAISSRSSPVGCRSLFDGAAPSARRTSSTPCSTTRPRRRSRRDALRSPARSVRNAARLGQRHQRRRAWQLHVVDAGSADVGAIDHWS